MDQRSLGKFSVLGHLLLDVVEQVASALASLSELFHLVGETCLQQGLHFLGMKVDSVTLHDGHCNGTFFHIESMLQRSSQSSVDGIFSQSSFANTNMLSGVL
uniref:(northern house mosquito) hypothetical protein n=1 Tax=Culex pipiens TaxID=7175 RepID=A0A8D8BUV6_CULPI